MLRPFAAAPMAKMYSTESLSVMNTNDQLNLIICNTVLQRKSSEDEEMVPERLYTKINIKVVLQYWYYPFHMTLLGERI